MATREINKEKVLNQRSVDKNKKVPFSFEHNELKFPSQPLDVFRSKAQSNAEGVSIWVESKKTKQQWQATLNDIGECGPAGIPEQAVLASLKRAFELVVVDGKLGDSDPEVDLVQDEGEMVLTLTLSMGSVWKPEYVINLLPVGLEKVDMLEAKLRDAQEEFETLQALQLTRPAVLSISSNTACGYRQMVVWNAVSPCIVTDTHFKLSIDQRQVTILQEGLYQVNVRLAAQSFNGRLLLSLQVNGVDVAQCTQSDGKGNGQESTLQIFEIMDLKANDVLQVRCGVEGMNVHSLSTPNTNRLTILFLGA